MPKQKTRSTKAPTKKQIALSGRQRQQKKKAYIGLAVLAGLIGVVVIVGLYDNLIARPSRPVAVVNNTSIRLDQYQARLRYERFTLDVLTRRIDAQLAGMNTSDPSSDFMVQYFQQVRTQVVQQRAGLATQVVDTMVEEQLARQKADEVGVKVSEDEVNEVIRARMAQETGLCHPDAGHIHRQHRRNRDGDGAGVHPNAAAHRDPDADGDGCRHRDSARSRLPWRPRRLPRRLAT